MKILIADDHALFREGLLHVLTKLENVTDILESFDYASTLDIASAQADIDLVLLDLNMPGPDGFSILRALGKQYPALPVVIVSASEARADIQAALNEGALGFIPKNTTSDVMLSALRLILSGGIYVPNSYLQYQHFITTSPTAPILTNRQLDVLIMIVEGKSNKLIAAELDVAESTVKMHVTAVFKALGVSNRTQAALMAGKLNLDRPS